jgi:hypothetical protein
MPGFDNGTVFADNVDFTGNVFVNPQVTADGQLLIGSATSPNIRVGTLTAGSGVSITNGAGSITIGLSGSGQAVDSFTTDLNGPILPDSNGNVAITGATNIFSDGSVANTLRLNLQGTNHSLFVGRGTNTASTSLGVATNGQIPIGSTGLDPVLASPTNGNNITWTTGAGSLRSDVTGTTNHAIQLGNLSGSLTSLGVATNGQIPIGSTGADPVLASPTNGNNISWTIGAGSLRSDVTGTTNHAIQLGNSGGSLTSLGVATNGQIPIGSTGADPVLATLTQGTGISISNGAGSITISATGSFTWTEVTGTSQSASVNNGYIANNASLVTITLPSTFAVGDIVRIGGKGTGLWRLAANTGDTIHFGNQDTSASGSLTATNRYDSIEVVGITANSDWLVLSSVGNLTVA